MVDERKKMQNEIEGRQKAARKKVQMKKEAVKTNVKFIWSLAFITMVVFGLLGPVFAFAVCAVAVLLRIVTVAIEAFWFYQEEKAAYAIACVAADTEEERGTYSSDFSDE